MFDYLIVGCGLSGVTAARLLAEKNKKVLLVDKRNHVAGNTYDYHNEYDVLIHKYGPHIFHTNSNKVWSFLSRFTQWREYQHRVEAYVEGMMVPMPINLDTINLLYNTNYNTAEVEEFLNSLGDMDMDIKDSKDTVVSKVGERLYKLFFEGYTKKQWNLYPEELEKEVIARIPIRTNKDNRYFTDRYQGLPMYGYTSMILNMLAHKNLKVLLNTNFNEIKDEIKYSKLIYTGCIDEYFDYKYGKLPYRSLRFEFVTYDIEQFQRVGVVNYPNDYDFTRITEYKHMTGQKCPKTTVTREYPTDEGEPYYPVPQAKNKQLYKQYKALADKTGNVCFLGRLGTYSYMNMDQIVLQAIELVDNL